MPLRSQLKNGYQVEIITSKAQTPSPTWESFVVTGKARACIRRFVRSQQRQEYVRLGREIAEKAFRQQGYEFTEKALRGVLKIFKAETLDDLLMAGGDGQGTGREVVNADYPGVREEARERKRKRR